MAKPYMEMQASNNAFDMWRLSKAGGRIVLTNSGMKFRFDSKSQYQKYLELNNERHKS